MKRVYWRPQKISKLALLLIGLVAVGGTLAIEFLSFGQDDMKKQTKLVASQLAEKGMLAIRNARLEKGHTFERRFDPAQSGLIGEAKMTLATSLPGDLRAKQTSVNPNFAAVVVDMLQQAGVAEGDIVAVGCTGSLPAFNTCVFTAIEAMGAKPIVIHSAASSQFGANRIDMMWLDMERVLYDQAIISFRSSAGTLGGFGDRANELGEQAQAVLQDSLDRNQVSLLPITSLRQSIRQRKKLYEKQAAGKPIKAYINVGGGAASIHGADGRAVFGPGLSVQPPPGGEEVICVASLFAAEGVPVINMAEAKTLAKRYGLPLAPEVTPEVGTGDVFFLHRPNRLLAAALLVALLVVIRVYIWTDLWTQWKSRLLGETSPAASDPTNPHLPSLKQGSQGELMV